jgi:histone H3/H4
LFLKVLFAFGALLVIRWHIPIRAINPPSPALPAQKPPLKPKILKITPHYLGQISLFWFFWFKTIKYGGNEMATEKLLPLAAMEKILKNCGAERASDKAKAALKDVVEEIAAEIAERAVKLAVHSGRVTVKADDVKLAAKY